jgi:hypothetical protein
MIQDQSQASEEMTTVQLVESAKIFIDAKKWQDAILLIENARQKQYLSDTCLEMLADSYSQHLYGALR